MQRPSSDQLWQMPLTEVLPTPGPERWLPLDAQEAS